MKHLGALLVLLAPSAALASEQFAGWYIGPAVGAVQTRFVIDAAATGNRVEQPAAWGVGYGAFAGHDWSVGPGVLLGLGVELNLGGQTARSSSSQLGFFSELSPRWGYSVTGRVGFSPTKSTLLYFRSGYHAHQYRLVSTGNVASDGDEWSSSISLGVGGEVRVSARTSVRLEYHHLNGTRKQIMLGVPFRF